ncbi:hypothetical protein KY306_02040, partial [Candidatus Woesearchaeota archaeon]|nr:hypothetical protein [Candidatus Woesearchaeota archaeon]
NWTSFLKAALNFRYYAIFADILDVFGPDQAEEWVWEAAYLGKQYGLDIALRTLMPITGFHSVFIDDKDEKLSTETLSAKHELGVCVLNDLPVWIPGMFNEKPGIHVENKKGDLVLKVWTMSENPLFPVGEIINKKLNELEHLGGLTAWNYRKDLTWHLENKL